MTKSITGASHYSVTLNFVSQGPAYLMQISRPVIGQAHKAPATTAQNETLPNGGPATHQCHGPPRWSRASRGRAHAPHLPTLGRRVADTRVTLLSHGLGPRAEKGRASAARSQGLPGSAGAVAAAAAEVGAEVAEAGAAPRATWTLGPRAPENHLSALD